MGTLEVKDLSLIYGSNKKHALQLLAKGKTKTEIFTKTKCVVAVNKVSFSVKAAELFVIMGLSGSGKSSLLRCLNMLNIPTQGAIFIDGQDITKMDKSGLLTVRRKKIGMVFQHFALLPHKTIIENVAFGLKIQHVSLNERLRKAQEVIDMVGLNGYEQSFPDQLSGGMQQRVGIARAIATDSDILLMDEAFSALDPLIRAQMQDELIDLQQKLKKTIVFITHDLDEALKLGETIAIMKDGCIIQQDSAENILLNPADDYVRAFIDNVDSAKVITACAIMKPFKARGRLDKDTPITLLRQMNRFYLNFIPMVDQLNCFKGYIFLRTVHELFENNSYELSAALVLPAIIPENTPVVDSLVYFTDINAPITVVDDNDRPVGYLRYSDVVEMISGNGGDTAVAHKPEAGEG